MKHSCYLLPLLVSFVIMFLRSGSTEDVPLTEGEEMESTELLDKLRQTLEIRGSTNTKAFGRVFLRMDDDGSKGLSLKEFTEGVNDTGLKLSAEDLDALFKEIDTDNSDNINISEFLRAQRFLFKNKVKEVQGLTQQRVHDLFQPVMNEVRVSFVKKAFRELDKTGDEVLTIDDLKEDYIVKHHPKFVNGEETEQEIVSKYLSNFEKDKNGQVTEDEFVNYFAGISASIDDDAYFEVVIRQAYNVTNEGQL